MRTSGIIIDPRVHGVVAEEPSNDSFAGRALKKAGLAGAILTGSVGTMVFPPHVPAMPPSPVIPLFGILQPGPTSAAVARTVADTSPSEPAPTQTSATALRRLREDANLTWDQVARLFGVSRRAVHLWAAGGRMNASHAEFLGHVLRTVDSLSAQGPDEKRTQLFTLDEGGRSLFDWLRMSHLPEADGSSESGYSFDQLLGAKH